MREGTATQRLVDHILGGNLDQYVQTRRDEGKSWRLIARDLWTDIGVDVTYETLRSWYPDDRQGAA